VFKYLAPAAVLFFGLVANALAGATAKDCPGDCPAQCCPQPVASCAGVQYAIVEAPQAGCAGAPTFRAPAVRAEGCAGSCAGSRYTLAERRAGRRAARYNARATRAAYADAGRRGAVVDASVSMPNLVQVPVQAVPACKCGDCPSCN
jgi:hypothetical protein